MNKYFFLTILFLTNSTFCQTNLKFDKIIKKDNEILEVKIQKISNDEVEFNYPNESIKNLLNTNLIKTIVFASGRIQNFESKNVESSKPKEVFVEEENKVQKTNSIASKSIEPNTIAVLPINFYDKNNGVFLEQNATLAQQQIIKFLLESSSNIMPLKIIDYRKINSSLRKANILFSDLDNTPIEDLHQILGVEYVITGKAAYTLTRTNTATSTKTKTLLTDEDMTLSSTQEDITYDYEIAIDVYKNNINIYSKTREPFFKFKDSWQDAFEYLLKRAPFYHE